MNDNFISQLIDFVATPTGIIGIAIGILIFFKASASVQTGWLLFSLCGFAASLHTFSDRWHKTAPPLLFPLQQLRSAGRPLSIVLLILLVCLALQTQNNWRRQIFPPPIKYLIAVQLAILVKTLFYGNIEFALVSALTFGGIILMLQKGPGRWLQNDQNFYLAARSIGMVSLIFVAANTYQYVINRYPVAYIHGRFMGTTGNPQHAAVLLAATIPCLIFLIQTAPNWGFSKFLWGGTLMGAIYFLVLTGSRTGLLMGAISILLFYRNNQGAWIRSILAIAIVTVLVMPFLEPANLTSSATGIDPSVSDRFVSTNDNRAGVWDGLWRSFSKNMIFGVPLQGDRLGYGENSWLSTGANLGLVGFIPMIMMGWESIKLIWRLDRLGTLNSDYFLQSSTVIAGLGSMLIGSLFEAFLLGNITFSLLAFLTYLLMGAYLVEIDRVRSYYES
jgi:hypothetical protein